MKKFLLILAAVAGLAGLSHASGFEVNKASFTVTNETNVRIPGTARGSMLAGVIVSSPTSGGVVKLYDSQTTSANQIAAVSMNTSMQYDFNVPVSSGIVYTTTLNSNGITILWR